jgi:sugar porter (SP) family MFS transporter
MAMSEPMVDLVTPKKSRLSITLFGVGLVIMLAGTLFGYDQGVISGALNGIKSEYHTSTILTEIITSWVTLGAMVGALIAGAVADRLGRRWTVLLASILFVFGALIEALAPNTTILIIGRFTVGFGVGVASVAAPLYAAEMAPTRLRGRFVSLYQLAITIGIFVAYYVDYLLSHSSKWRVMLGVSAVPAVLLVLAIIPLPDSPRWYMSKGRRERAEMALAKVEPDCNVTERVDEIAAAVEEDAKKSASWAVVFSQQWRKPLIIGISLAVLQQFTGINAVIYYANQIFAAAGFKTPDSQGLATLWAIGAVNVLATFVAVAWVDRFGRKPLLMIGSSGMFLSLVLIGAMYLKLDHHSGGSSPSMAGIVTLIGLVVFIACFAFSLGPIVWTVINEIFPGEVRGKAVAAATAANWFAAWLVTQFFLTLIDAIGSTGVFWLFAGFCVVTFVFVRRFLPETKGRSLEEIQTMWGDPQQIKDAIHDYG